MPRLVTCRVVDRPDGLFDVAAGVDAGGTYRRTGFETRAEADACIEMLQAIMAAYGAPLMMETREPTPPMSDRASARFPS